MTADMHSALGGIAVSILAGTVGGSHLMPMKYVRQWPWENTWLVYSIFAYLLFPCFAAIFTVPHLFAVYEDSGRGVLLMVSALGLAWGAGVVLYGVALAIVGLSLTSGIILGCSVALGSLVPMLALEPGRLGTKAGVQILEADLIIVLGVMLCARAGGLRDQSRSPGGAKVRDSRFARGILICFISGLLAPLLNIALTLGAEITKRVLADGANPFWAANGVWGLTVSFGSLPSLGLCVIRLRQNRSWQSFHNPMNSRNSLFCFLMGVGSIFSTVLYGSAAGLLGNWGPVVGWPIYTSALIIGNNFWGWYTGEWKGSRGVPVYMMFAGIALQVAGIGLLGSSRLSGH
jgi:L-rhamnose-H+ transport protein